MKKHRFFIIVGILVIIFASVFIAISFSYKNKFLPNTVINDVNVSNKSVAASEKELLKAQPEYTFTLTSNNQDWDTITESELGVTFNYKDGLNKLLEEQNSWSWLTCYIRSPKKQTISNSSIDDATFSASQEELKNKLNAENEKRTKTTDATIEFQNASYTIVPETQGTQLNVDALIEEFDTDVKEGKTSLDMDSFVIKPTVTSDDSTLKANLKKIEKLSTQSISYLINGNEVTVPVDTIKTWIQYTDGNISVNTDAITNYVTELGAKYNTSTNNLDFKSTSRGTVSVPPGSYNWTIQTQTETNELSAIVLSGEGVSGRTPAYQGSGNPSSALVKSTYIEVDLQRQHMWYYKDGNVQIETDVITGKPSTPTPVGVFYVWNKERNATLVGEDYKTPVDHWMPIDWEGVGIHDSPWQSAYGGTLYTTVGSHGCINTPPAVVAQLFDAVEVGTPVIVF